MKFAIVLASLLISGTSAQNWSCDSAAFAECSGSGDTTMVCASNGVTYENRCYFDKANCDNKGWRVLHNGRCARRSVN
eukprot:jgi/Phyca11/509064/fgenesh2_kg.PHYCAscaffold_41_\